MDVLFCFFSEGDLMSRSGELKLAGILFIVFLLLVSASIKLILSQKCRSRILLDEAG